MCQFNTWCIGLAVHNTLFFGYMYPNLQTYIFLCFFCVKFLTLVVYNFLT